jgi:hypothetical protein
MLATLKRCALVGSRANSITSFFGSWFSFGVPSLSSQSLPAILSQLGRWLHTVRLLVQLIDHVLLVISVGNFEALWAEQAWYAIFLEIAMVQQARTCVVAGARRCSLRQCQLSVQSTHAEPTPRHTYTRRPGYRLKGIRPPCETTEYHYVLCWIGEATEVQSGRVVSPSSSFSRPSTYRANSLSQSRRLASKHHSTSKHAAACITFHPLDCSLLHSHTNRRVICLFHTVPHVQSAPRMRYLQNIGHGMGGPCRARRYDEERHLRLSAPSLHVVVLVNIPVVASTACLSHFVNLLSINQSLFLIASSTLAF